MAHGGVYDQLAGGFHRYSVDEHWSVPALREDGLRQLGAAEELRPRLPGLRLSSSTRTWRSDIIRWMDEWLSDRERGGFYASQDADINLDDDGDYFTWTRDEARAVLSAEEFEAAALHYDIGEVG